MWEVCKKAWGLQSELVGDPFQAFTRLSVRLFDGTTPQYLLNYLTVQATATSLLTVVVAAVVIFQRRRRVKLHPGAAVAFLTAALYVCGLYAIYLSTPYNFLFSHHDLRHTDDDDREHGPPRRRILPSLRS